MPPAIDIACIGAAHIDYIAKSRAAIVQADSNPVDSIRSPGGVALNVALALQRLGHTVRLVTAFGNDGDGADLTSILREFAVPVIQFPVPGHPSTGRYSALLDSTGNLVIGMADMAIYEAITIEMIQEIILSGRLADCRAWCIDANLPAHVLSYLARVKPESVTLAANAVSVQKAGALLPVVDSIDIVCGNRAEITGIADALGIPDGTIGMRLRRLQSRVNNVYAMTCADDGAFMANEDGLYRSPAMTATVRNVTGAGDCFMAGLLSGILNRYSLYQTLATAMAAAACSIASVSPVPKDLSMDGVREIICTQQSKGHKCERVAE